MTTRYRWFTARWPSNMRTLARQLRAMTFNDERAVGFVVDRVRDEFLEARYVERIEYDEQVVDPFGKELSFHRIEFRQTRFRASSVGPGLELMDPARAIQPLLSRLAEACEFSLSLSSLEIDVVAWSRALQRNLRITAAVDHLQIGAIDLEPGVIGKVVLKGTGDVLAAGERLTAGRKRTIERLQLRIGQGAAVGVLLMASGSVKLEREPDDSLLEALRASLPTVTRK